MNSSQEQLLPPNKFLRHISLDLLSVESIRRSVEEGCFHFHTMSNILVGDYLLKFFDFVR
jgi:hypothetical protein